MVVVLFLASIRASADHHAKNTLAEEIIATQENFLSAVEPRPELSNNENNIHFIELRRRINFLLSYWEFVVQGKSDARNSIKNSTFKILLEKKPNQIELQYIGDSKFVNDVIYEHLEYFSGSREERKMYMYGYNSEMKNEIEKRRIPILDIPYGTTMYSKFAIPWIFDLKRDLWIESLSPGQVLDTQDPEKNPESRNPFTPQPTTQPKPPEER